MNTTTTEQNGGAAVVVVVAETRQTLLELIGTAGIHAEAADDSGGVRLFTSQDATGYAHRAAFSLADYGVDAVCGPFVHLMPRDQHGSVAGCRMRRRGPDGFAVGSDEISREAYGKIPVAAGGRFQKQYGAEVPIAVHGWAWSDTFGRWGALVTFADGWRGFTWPATWSNLSETETVGRGGAEVKEVRARD